MNIDEIVTKHSRQLAAEEIEYSQLDSILNIHLLESKQIKEIKSQIDEKAQNIILNRNEAKLKRQQFIQGLIILFLGAGITITSFLGLGLFANSKIYIISTGLMGFGGFSIFKSKKNVEERDPKKRMKRYFEKK